MTAINVQALRKNHTVYTATLEEPALLELVKEAVAGQAGVDLDKFKGSIRAYTSGYQEGSLGTRKISVVVELIVDHE